MSALVVDASVAVKWLVPEIHSAAAVQVLARASALLAPDLIWAELGNVLWKKRRRGELTADVARNMLRDFRRFPFTVHAAESLMEEAFNIADGFGRSVYDSLYLALALREGCPLVTADRRFYEAMEGGPLGSSLRWVEDST